MFVISKFCPKFTFDFYARDHPTTIKIKLQCDVTFHCKSSRGWTNYTFSLFLRMSRHPDTSEHNKFYPLSSSGSPLLMLHSGINSHAYNEKRPFMNTKSQEHIPQARIYSSDLRNAETTKITSNWRYSVRIKYVKYTLTKLSLAN